MRLKDRVSLVTGASRGIGFAIARAFVAEGAAVALTARDAAALERAVQELRDAGGRAIGVSGSVANDKDVVRMVATTLSEFGRLDCLVNNAGGGHGSRSLETLAASDYDSVLDVDLRGTFFCCREAIKVMKAAGGGVIVNISSQGGRYVSEISGPHYAAAKAGVLGLTRELAKEFGPFGIRINAITPGVVLTPRAEAKVLTLPAEERERMIRAIPLGRFGRPEDVAGVAVFLASDEAGYITGATVDVNGGRFMA
jgi:NAD(P)-dependent dehydrogenase (short-subunit alcohol dehydrogenase family)